MNKFFINLTLLVSALFVLPGCEWFKGRFGCKDCPAAHVDGDTSTAVTGATDDKSQPLLLIGDKPCITVQKFEEFWDEFLKSDSRLAAFVALYPNARYEVFKNQCVPGELIKEWAQRTGKQNDPEYQQKLKKARENIDKAIAMQAFEEAVMKEIDTSDAALEKFYRENREKEMVLQQPPFVKTPAGIKAVAVEFTDEKAANEFSKKAEETGKDFNQLAKEANKEVKDLGVVNAQSRKVDASLRLQVPQMEVGKIDVVDAGKDKFFVVKALDKQSPEYAEFKDVKDMVKQALMQVQGTKQFTQKLEDLKKEYDVKENAEFFQKESEKKKAEFEAELKSLEEQEKAEQGEEAGQAPDEANQGGQQASAQAV